MFQLEVFKAHLYIKINYTASSPSLPPSPLSLYIYFIFRFFLFGFGGGELFDESVFCTTLMVFLYLHLKYFCSFSKSGSSARSFKASFRGTSSFGGNFTSEYAYVNIRHFIHWRKLGIFVWILNKFTWYLKALLGLIFLGFLKIQ